MPLITELPSEAKAAIIAGVSNVLKAILPPRFQFTMAIVWTNPPENPSQAPQTQINLISTLQEPESIRRMMRIVNSALELKLEGLGHGNIRSDEGAG